MSATNATSRPSTFQERWDSAPPAPGTPLNRSERITLAAIMIGIVAVCVGAGLGMHRYMSDPWSPPNWINRAGTVQDSLNGKYVEDIQAFRETNRGNKIEIFVIDGRMREDCTVQDDRHPALTCEGPVRLHLER